MKYLLNKITTAALLTASPLAVLADDVTITSKDNAVSISGELVSFDDDNYLILTDIGELTLSRSSTSCEGEACPETTINVDLSVSVTEPKTAGLLQALVNGFASSRDLAALSVPDATGNVDRIDIQNFTNNTRAGSIEVSLQNATAGFNQLVNDDVDLAITQTAVPTNVAVSGVAVGGADLRDLSRERVIALDALVPVVHPNNPVRSISLRELADIAGGRIRNWSELGGDNVPIRAILPAEGSSIDTAFASLVLDPNRVRLRRTAERATDETQATSVVATDETAITITSLSGAGDTEILPIRQTCGPLAYASDFAIKAEEYPLSRRVFAYTARDQIASSSNDFLSFLGSADAQPLIQNAGYVDQNIISQPISLQGTRMTSAILSATTPATLALVQNFSRDLATAERLSTTFRFTSGSSGLDTKSLADVERMVDFLNSPEARNRQILVIGFTDAVGRFDLNERLALLRATGLRDALVGAVGGDALSGRIAVSSYGPLAPVGCNETADGRESNRRVEIWLQ